jgi:hypothetical protein
MNNQPMRTRILTTLLALSTALVFTWSGCGKKAEIKAKTSALELAFPATAPADARALAQAALAAIRTNDYAGGIMALDSLALTSGLTPEQLIAVQNAKESLMNDVVDRAANGDAKAKAVLDAREKTRSQ